MSPEGLQCRLMIERALTDYQLPASEAAIRLLCMIAAHESGGFSYVKQVRGPALSFFQMEPATYSDVSGYAMKKGYLKGELPSPVQRLIFDAFFSAALARIFFLRFRKALPNHNDIPGLAQYAKHYWNTELGKATPAMYADAWRQYFEYT